MNKEQYTKLVNSLKILIKESSEKEKVMSTDHDTYSNGYDDCMRDVESAIQRLGKLLEEIEYYGLK